MDVAGTTSIGARLSWAPARLFKAVGHFLRTIQMRRQEPSLRVCESVSLGERRFVVIVQYEQRRFLIGSTSQCISLLERLEDRKIPQQNETTSETLDWRAKR